MRLRSRGKSLGTVNEGEGTGRITRAKAAVQEGGGNGTYCKVMIFDEDGDGLSSSEDVAPGINESDEECVGKSVFGRKRGRVDSEVEGESVTDRKKKVKDSGSVDQGEVACRVLSLSASAEAECCKHSGARSIVLGLGMFGAGGSRTRTFDANKEFHGTPDGKLMDTTKDKDDRELRSRGKAKFKEECVGEMSTDSAKDNGCKLIDSGRGEDGSCGGQNNVLEGEGRDAQNDEESSELGGVAMSRKINETESGGGVIHTKNTNEKDLDGHVTVTHRVLLSTSSEKSEPEKDLAGEKSKVVVVGTGTNIAHVSEMINSEVKEHDVLRKELDHPSDCKSLEEAKEDGQESRITAKCGEEQTGKDLTDFNGDKDCQLTNIGKEDEGLFADQNIVLEGHERTEMKNNNSNEHNHNIIHEADDGREECEKDGVKKGGPALVRKMKARGKDLDGQMHIVRRVLRSNTLPQAECDKDVISLGVETGTDECNESDSEVKKKRQELLDVECTGPLVDEEKQLKRKRGRPPKSSPKGETDIPRKRGRPPKGWLKDETDSPRKRGRPFKVSRSNNFNKIRLKYQERVETGKSRGRPKKLCLIDDDCSDVAVKEVEKDKNNESRKRGPGRPPKVKPWKKKHMHARPREKLQNTLLERMSKIDEGDAHVGKGLGVNISEVQKTSKSKEVDEELEQEKVKPTAGDSGARKLEKQLVRDKIVDMLLSAGWTIDYRPRNGRVYNDAVYVNPEGRTHWSVTKAYRMLKDHYDNGGGHSASCKPGFKFSPLSDEEIEVLRRVVGKVRCDKNKKKKDWRREKQGLKKGGALTKPKGKEKLNKGGKMTKSKNSSKRLSSSDQMTAVKGNKHRNDTKRYGLMVRNTTELSDRDGGSYLLYNAKRTVLSWMIDLGCLLLDAKVEYIEGRKMQTAFTGTIVSEGIQCDCCSRTFTVPLFVNHAGCKTRGSYNITYLDDGRSLLQCQLDSWLKQKEPDLKGFHFVDTNGDDPNDDTCGICGDGGDLICCDGCPSTFHQSCLGFENFPSGFWNCIYCCCKFCGEGGEKDPTAVQPLLQCSLCEESYHVSCVQENDSQDDDPMFQSFCGKNCQELYQRLQLLLGVKHELEDGFSWTLVRRFDVGTDISLSGMPQKVECNSKTAVALQIMDECFLPMADHRSGVNLIRNVVYNFGSNFTRLNYSGFLTMVLEREDEMISAASIRIHGNHLAEMPFIGTRHMYRRQGMCRRLLSAIDSALSSLNVERLVIPAISELKETWTSVFGFAPLERLSSPKIRNMNMLVFPRVDMLQKPVLSQQPDGCNMATAEGSKLNDSDDRCPAGFDLNSTYEPTESCSLPDGCLNHTSDLPHNLSDGEPLDEICEIPGNVEKNGANIHNPISVGDAREQSGEFSEPMAAITDERKLESGSESLISHVGSESGDCRRQSLPDDTAASSEVNLEEKMVPGKAPPLEVNPDGKMVDLNLASHEGSVDDMQVMDDEHTGLPLKSEPSSTDDIHQGSETKILPDEILQSHENDESNSRCGIPDDHQDDSCQQKNLNEAHGREVGSTPLITNEPSHSKIPESSDISVAAERDAPSLMKQHRPNTEDVQPVSPAAEVDIDRLTQHGEEAESTPLITNEPSHAGAPDTGMEPQCQTHEHERDAPSLMKQPQPNTGDMQPVDIDRMTQRSLEPMCSSTRSGPGVGVHLPDLGASVPTIPQR